MASELAIVSSSPEETWSRFRIRCLPVCVHMADVSFDINRLLLWIGPFELHIVHSKKSFAGWFCNDFKSFAFQPTTLQCVFHSMDRNLDRPDNLIQR